MADEEIHRDVDTLSEPFRTLISAAIIAPSGDNTQGWDFGIDESGHALEIFRNDRRDTSPMNAGQRMSSIACGACAENILRTVEAVGGRAGIEYSDLPSIKISWDGDWQQSAEIPSVVASRHTNRKLYRGRRIGAAERKTLEDRIDVPDGIELRFITERPAIDRCADVIGTADARMFGQRRFLRAFLDNVRFDQPAGFPVEFGLSMGSLELNLVERQLLRQMRHFPEVVTGSFPMRRAFRQKATRLVESASGLCVIHSLAATTESEFKVGQAMQLAWLTLTELGFAVQPMMSLPVLLGDAHLARTSEQFDSASQLDDLAAMFESIFGTGVSGRAPGAILRFGEGSPSTKRTGRRKSIAIRQVRTIYKTEMQLKR